MVCDTPPSHPTDEPDEHGLTAEDLARLHGIRREALIQARQVREMLASRPLPATVATEITDRLAGIRAAAAILMDRGGAAL